MHALLTLVLAASPVTVRVLEKEHPLRATVEAQRISCGAEARPASLPSAPRETAVLEVKASELTWGDKRCPDFTAAGDVTVHVDALTRSYRGTVRVGAEGSVLRFVLETDVEDYLPAVVAAELDAAPPSAMQAQAIVSRTFALGSRRRHGSVDLCDLTHCQLFRGRTDESAPALEAVKQTRGQVLLVGGVALEPAFFHAACGGHTSRPADVFRTSSAAPGVSDVSEGKPLCAGIPDFAWSFTTERRELAAALGTKTEGAAFEALRRDEAGRVVELRVFGTRFTGAEFLSRMGRAFGWQAVRSLKLRVEEAQNQVHFTGTGLGHGVGLCQQGARALAEKGVDATAILERYFPQARLRVP